MPRVMYETSADLRREQQVINKICLAWGCAANKNPCPPYKIDWSVIKDNEIKAMVEIKTSPKQYPTYRLALHKYKSLLSNAALIKTIIAIQILETIYWQDVSALKPLRYVWWRDGRQRDATDNEPAVVFDWHEFNRIQI